VRLNEVQPFWSKPPVAVAVAVAVVLVLVGQVVLVVAQVV
jgi:hypothetical protein